MHITEAGSFAAALEFLRKPRRGIKALKSLLLEVPPAGVAHSPRRAGGARTGAGTGLGPLFRRWFACLWFFGHYFSASSF